MAQSALAGQVAQVVRIVGRVDFVKQSTPKQGGKPTFLTLIKTPAPDSFSNPSTLEVRSGVRIGAVGEDVDVHCNLKGYRQTGISGRTGEPFTRAQNVLEVIAA